jgi:hypothetical protein
MAFFSDSIKHGDPRVPPVLEIRHQGRDIYSFELTNYIALIPEETRPVDREKMMADIFRQIDCVATDREAFKLGEMLAQMVERNKANTQRLKSVTGDSVRELCRKILGIERIISKKSYDPVMSKWKFARSFEISLGGSE